MVVNFKLTFNLLKELQLRFAIDNLFDRNYSYVRSYPMPERTFTAGLRYKF
jgi:vitamin B12 transporter